MLTVTERFTWDIFVVGPVFCLKKSHPNKLEGELFSQKKRKGSQLVRFYWG